MYLRLAKYDTSNTTAEFQSKPVLSQMQQGTSISSNYRELFGDVPEQHGILARRLVRYGG